MKHVNKHHTTQDTLKQHSQDKRARQNKTKQNKTKQKHTFTGLNQSITPGHHAQWNNYMYKAYSNDI